MLVDSILLGNDLIKVESENEKNQTSNIHPKNAILYFVIHSIVQN
jgi:hypothetical protein